MSFVISESKRELDFYMNQNRSGGPTVGPGAYYTPQWYARSQCKVPFGSGSRRHLEAPHQEIV